MELILVRHGQPETFAGDTPADPPLSAQGRAQAQRVCAFLAKSRIDCVAHSGMARASQTAAPLVEHLGIAPKVLVGLGEVDRYGVNYANAETIRAKGKSEWRHFLSDPIGYFGIDEASFCEETLAAFFELIASSDNETIAVFTHGFPINILISHCLGTPKSINVQPGYASITRIGGSAPDRLAVISVNETAHLSDHFAELLA
jgi:broad specificity phosphatase PhoE